MVSDEPAAQLMQEWLAVFGICANNKSRSGRQKRHQGAACLCSGRKEEWRTPRNCRRWMRRFCIWKRLKCRCMSAAWRSSACRRTITRNFFEDFKAMIASRLHIAPILKARLEKAPLDIDHPSWVEDDQFDIDRHIFRGSLPAPYDRATLERIVGWMHGKSLNRARPLWEFYVFEGMKDNEIGLYSKMHHACIDGGAGAALTNMIYDVTPVPRKVEKPIPQAKGNNEPRDIAANLIDSYQQLWRQPFDGSSTPKTHRFAAFRKERSRIYPVRQRHVPDRERSEIRRQYSGDAQERLRRRRQDLRPEVARQHRQHGFAVDHFEQGDFVRAQFRRHIDLAVAGQGGRQGIRRQAQRRGAGALLPFGPALSARSAERCPRSR